MALCNKAGLVDEGRDGLIWKFRLLGALLFHRQDLTDKAYPPPPCKFRPPDLPPPKLPDSPPVDLVKHLSPTSLSDLFFPLTPSLVVYPSSSLTRGTLKFFCPSLPIDQFRGIFTRRRQSCLYDHLMKDFLPFAFEIFLPFLAY